MGILMNNLSTQQRLKKINWIKRIVAMIFGVGSVAMFFLPYVQFIFQDTRYVATGLDLLIASGFRVETEAVSALVGIPVLIRISVITGAVFALRWFFFKGRFWQGFLL